MGAESLLISPRRLKSRARGLYGFGLSGRERVQSLELLLELGGVSIGMLVHWC